MKTGKDRKQLVLKKRRVTVWVRPQIKDFLENRAKAQKLPLSHYCNKVLAKWVDDLQKKMEKKYVGKK